MSCRAVRSWWSAGRADGSPGRGRLRWNVSVTRRRGRLVQGCDCAMRRGWDNRHRRRPPSRGACTRQANRSGRADTERAIDRCGAERSRGRDVRWTAGSSPLPSSSSANGRCWYRVTRAGSACCSTPCTPARASSRAGTACSVQCSLHTTIWPIVPSACDHGTSLSRAACARSSTAPRAAAQAGARPRPRRPPRVRVQKGRCSSRGRSTRRTGLCSRPCPRRSARQPAPPILPPRAHRSTLTPRRALQLDQPRDQGRPMLQRGPGPNQDSCPVRERLELAGLDRKPAPVCCPVACSSASDPC